MGNTGERALSRPAPRDSGQGRCEVAAVRVERSDEQTERGGGIVNDLRPRPDLTNRSFPPLGGQRGPRLLQVLALNLLSDDPIARAKARRCLASM